MRAILVPLVLALATACRSGPTDADAAQWLAKEVEARNAPPPASPSFPHTGPGVAPGGTGPARFALLLWESFDAPRALECVRFVERWWREPGNDGYQAVLERLEEELRSLHFGSDPARELRVIETPMKDPAWTPLAGRLVLRTSGGERVLHAFDAPEDRDRLLVPKNAPSCAVEGAIALDLASVRPGSVLVVEEHHSRALLDAARERGAVAVLSASLEDYNTDPSGQQRHLDAIQYASVPAGTTLAAGQISRRALQAIRGAAAQDPAARLSLSATVRFDKRSLRTLVATLVGSEKPEEAVAVVAHVQEPGACDNASGVATALEALRALCSGLDGGRIERPARSVSFVWGLEMRESSILIEQGGRTIVAAVVGDMTGESGAQTGAMALLERPPDPAAVELLAPDAHTAWGAGSVPPAERDASGIALVARTALHDTALAAGGWQTREHPFEGGSDHQVFLGAGIPAVLFWHFTDFSYHTSADRIELVDAEELRRSGTALLSTALALADPRPGDLERYLRTLKLESVLHANAAREASKPELGARWEAWERLQRQWLRKLCLGAKAGELPAPRKAAPPRSAAETAHPPAQPAPNSPQR